MNILLGYFWTFPKHSILLIMRYYCIKLEHYGVRGTVLERFKNYVLNRKQTVNQSDVSIITCGVPQGLVRGPLFFFIFVNDISESSKLLSFLLFADDTNLFYSGRNPELLNQIANQESCKVADWLRADKISLNIDGFHCDVIKL